MIDVSNVIKSYVFKDGNKEIITKSPTQEMFAVFTSSDRGVDSLLEVFKSILKPEDAHYADELSPLIQMMIVKDYFEFHMGQLEEVLPIPFHSEQA